MNVITGYVLKPCSIGELESVLKKIKDKVKKTAEKEYYKLLGSELEHWHDEIAIGACQRPDGILFEFVKNQLANKIARSSAIQDGSRYDFNVSLNVFTYTNKNEEKYYIKFNANNNIYATCLNKISELSNYSLTDSEFKDVGNAKTLIWDKIMKKYEVSYPLSVQIIKGVLPSDIIFENISFSNVKERAEKIARHNLTMKKLNNLSYGEQIPPYHLMEYMDIALEEVSKDLEELKAQTEHLLANKIIVEITKECVCGEENTTEKVENI